MPFLYTDLGVQPDFVLHGASGMIPSPLWFVSLLGPAIVFGFVVDFADRAEGPVIRAMLIVTVTALLVSSLLLVRFLGEPFTLAPDVFSRLQWSSRWST